MPRKQGRTPLHVAAESDASHEAITSVVCVLGAHIEANDRGGEIPLHAAAAEEHGHYETARVHINPHQKINKLKCIYI